MRDPGPLDALRTALVPLYAKCFPYGTRKRAGRALPLVNKACAGDVEPHRVYVTMLRAGLAAGATADDLRTVHDRIGVELEAWIAERDGVDVPSLAECLRRETEAQAELDVVEMEVATAGRPAPAKLAEIIERAPKQRRWLGFLSIAAHRAERDAREGTAVSHQQLGLGPQGPRRSA